LKTRPVRIRRVCASQAARFGQVAVRRLGSGGSQSAPAQRAQAVGAIQLSGNQQALAPSVVAVFEQGQQALVAGRAGFEVEDRGLQSEAKSFADVEGFGNLESFDHSFMSPAKVSLACADCRGMHR
jgi:hypothetical protein